MTPGILKSMEERDRLFREQLGKNDENLSQIYRKKRNQVTRIIEKAKDLDFFSSFENIIDSPKKVWAKINTKLLNKKKSGSALPSEIQIGSETIKDKNVIANKLNEQFVNKGHILASKLPVSETPVTDSMKPPKNDQNIQKWRYILEQEILDIISNFILTHKSPGHDNIPAVLIRWSSHIIAPILVKLFNSFLDQGKYPDVLKIAKVTALHKGGDRANVDHYRSISVLTHINKIFEKLIYARLNDFVITHDILENSQFGFRKGHSTSHGITHLHETIIQNIERKKVCVALFIDLKSAFDTIDPEILVKKLHYYGIQGNALQILSSYLTNRKQIIRSDGVVSVLLNVVCGVPQGSVLGPLLFILYINDIHRCCKLDALLFADDAVLTMSHESVKVLQSKFNKEMAGLLNWFITNKLTLNLKKTKFMLFSKLKKKKSKEKKFKININKYCIKQVSEMKYLGVILDQKLNWHKHIQYVCTKLSKAAGIIYKVRKKVPQNVLLLLYHSLVATYLRYGIASWGSAKTTAMRKLRSLQNKILRYMTNTPRQTSVVDQYSRLNILSLDNLYVLEISKFMYRNSETSLPLAFDGYFRPIGHDYNTRTTTTESLMTPRPSTDFGKQSIKYTGVKVWNSLPFNIQSASNYTQFGSLVKTHILENQKL